MQVVTKVMRRIFTSSSQRGTANSGWIEKNAARLTHIVNIASKYMSGEFGGRLESEENIQPISVALPTMSATRKFCAYPQASRWGFMSDSQNHISTPTIGLARVSGTEPSTIITTRKSRIQGRRSGGALCRGKRRSIPEKIAKVARRAGRSPCPDGEQAYCYRVNAPGGAGHDQKGTTINATAAPDLVKISPLKYCRLPCELLPGRGRILWHISSATGEGGQPVRFSHG